MPQVTVIMPCYNHGKFVGKSIESILGQSSSDLELVVIDDCSRDDSARVISGYAENDPRVQPVFHQANRGESGSRNDGIARARGEFLAFCDADDVWYPTKLEKQLSAFREHPECDVAYCDANIIDEWDKPTGERFSERFNVPGDGSGYLFGELWTRNFINLQTGIARRRCVDEIGGLDSRIHFVEDWAFWQDLSRGRRFLYLNEVLAGYREHSRSTAFVARRGYYRNRLKVFARALRRYPWISGKRRSEVYYQLGTNLAALGRQRWARKYYKRSLAAGGLDPKALYRLLRSYC